MEGATRSGTAEPRTWQRTGSSDLFHLGQINGRHTNLFQLLSEHPQDTALGLQIAAMKTDFKT